MALAFGLATFALLLYGVLGILQGIAAIARGQVYAAVGSYVFRFNLTAWGWIHLVFGVILIATAVGLLRGSVLARMVAIAVTALEILASFLYLPYQPAWSIVMIGVGLFVVWALFRDVKAKTGT